MGETMATRAKAKEIVKSKTDRVMTAAEDVVALKAQFTAPSA